MRPGPREGPPGSGRPATAAEPGAGRVPEVRPDVGADTSDGAADAGAPPGREPASRRAPGRRRRAAGTLAGRARLGARRVRLPGRLARWAPRWLPRLRVAVFAVAGTMLALAVLGRVGAVVGPFETTFSVRPSLHGYSLVRLAPLGTIELDTHDWPLALDVRVDEIRVDAAERIADDPRAVTVLDEQVTEEVREALGRLALQAVVVAVGGGALGAVLARLSWRSAATGAAVGGLLIGSVAGGTLATFDVGAVSEPRYTGLLTMAPRAVGDIETVLDRYGQYREQLADLVENMAVLYLAGEGLPTFAPNEGTIRVLHVSDIHLNPQAFDLIDRVVDQFSIDAVVDTGDLTDWGTVPETRLLEQIGALEVPYVYVRGNHDSRATQAFVAAQPNAVVLDGRAATVAGLRFYGVGDPRYTPDKDAEAAAEPEKDRAEAVAPAVADGVREAGAPGIDVLLVHDERMAGDVGGLVPLVLAGHTHDARQDVIEPVDDAGDRNPVDPEQTGATDGVDTTASTDATGGTSGEGTPDAPDATGGQDALPPTILLVEGSTGGAGLRGLQGAEPEPLAASILYFDAGTRRLVAYDRLTVKGLGETGATIQRHIVSAPGEVPDDDGEESR